MRKRYVHLRFPDERLCGAVAMEYEEGGGASTATSALLQELALAEADLKREQAELAVYAVVATRVVAPRPARKKKRLRLNQKLTTVYVVKT